MFEKVLNLCLNLLCFLDINTAGKNYLDLIVNNFRTLNHNCSLTYLRSPFPLRS